MSFSLVWILIRYISLLKGSEEVNDCGHIALSAYLIEAKHLNAKDDFCLIDNMDLFGKKWTVILEY